MLYLQIWKAVISLEQEIASVIKFILDVSGNPAPYYWEMEQDFIVPAIYFPPPLIESDGHTFDKYSLSFSWYIKFFHSDTTSAHFMCQKALAAIQGRRCYIPLIDEKGNLTKHAFRLKDPKMRGVDDGAVQLTLMWDSPRAYFVKPRDSYKKVEEFDILINEAFSDALKLLDEGE